MQIVWDVVLSAGLSFVGAILGALISGRRQIQISAMAAFIPARLEAYKRLEQALEPMSLGVTPERAQAVYAAVNLAMLVASGKTQRHLKRLNNLVRLAERGESVKDLFFEEHEKLIDAMRLDLFRYPMPKSEGKAKGI